MESKEPFGQWHDPCGIESVDRNRVRLAVKLAISRLAVMQAGIGETGVSAMKGWEAQEPQSQNGRGGRASLEQGRDRSKRQKTCLEQPGQQQGLGTGPPETLGEGDTLP